MDPSLPPSTIIGLDNRRRSKADVSLLETNVVLKMCTQKAIMHIDMRDTMKKQFSPQEMDFFLYNYNLKMLDIKLLDRIYFQTSAVPYFQMMKAKNKKVSKENNVQEISHEDRTCGSHALNGQTVLNGSIIDYESTQVSSSFSSSTYDIVFGDHIKDQVYFVYKKSQAHIISDIHNLVIDKLKTESLLTCSPDPRNKVLISVNKKWYRAIITEWPPRIKGTVVAKLVDLGCYVDIDLLQSHCYKMPADISSFKPIHFEIKLTTDRFFPVGCIATIEQLNNCNTPLEANVLGILGEEEHAVSFKLSENYINCDISIDLNSPMTVFLLSKEGDYHWVQDVKFVDIYSEWHDILESNTSTIEKALKVGDYCVGNYEMAWCRAIVTGENPLKISYIDYGDEEVIKNTKDLKQMPDVCLSHGPFAFKIEWIKPNNTNAQFEYGDTVTIIPIEALDTNTFRVLREGESLEKENWTYKDKPINSCGGSIVMNKLQDVHLLDRTNEFLIGTASLDDNIELYNNISIQASIDNTHDISFEDIQEGDYVLILVKDSKQWHRAQLINQEQSIFYLIDTGKNFKCPEHFKSLFKDMWNLPPRLMKIKINNSLSKLCSINSSAELIPLYIDSDKCVISQLVSTPMFQLESHPPLTINKEYTAYFAMNDTIDKNISYFFLDFESASSSISEFHKLIESSPQLLHLCIGDYCGVLHEGSIYCRAKVLKVSGDKVTVFILDLGEIDIVSTRDCKELPVELYSQPSLIVKTRLLDSSFYLESQSRVTLVPCQEISRQFYSVNIVS